MGFWDFVAPDFDAFKRAVEPVLPPLIFVGLLPIPRDAVIALAWANPGSGAGLALRLYYERVKTAGGTISEADALNNAVQSQAGTTVVRGSWNVGGELAGVVVPNAYRVGINMIVGGRAISNVICVLGSAPGQQVAAANAVLTAWKVASGPLARLSALVAMTDVEATDLSSLAGGIALIADATTGGNTAQSSLSTRGSAALVRWNTATRSRSARGRLYYGPLAEADINTDGATLTSASLSNFSAAFTAFRTSLGSSSFPLQVLSTKLAQVTSVGSQAVDATIATQRRRIRS